MFENLLAQDEVRTLLSGDVASGRLPPTLLFVGPPGSGKSTAALELARVLSCGSGASWTCRCPSCLRHRTLAHADLALIGARTFPEEIPAARDILLRTGTKESAYFFVRSVRKLLRRFDAALFSGEEARLAKAVQPLRDAEEALSSLDPSSPTPHGDPQAIRLVERIVEACVKLETLVPDSPPVFMIRNVEAWSRLAPLGIRKTVVMENADRMLDSSRNALLKILEEPPGTVRFVLTAPRRGSLLATVLSRSRTYSFRHRTREETALVTERIFKTTERYGSVESCLAAWRRFTPAQAEAFARRFAADALANRASGTPPPRAFATFLERHSGTQDEPVPGTALGELLAATRDFGMKDDSFRDSFTGFLAALLGLVGALLRRPDVDARAVSLAGEWARLVRDVAVRYRTYNLNPVVLAEILLGAMGEAE